MWLSGGNGSSTYLRYRVNLRRWEGWWGYLDLPGMGNDYHSKNQR